MHPFLPESPVDVQERVDAEQREQPNLSSSEGLFRDARWRLRPQQPFSATGTGQKPDLMSSPLLPQQSQTRSSQQLQQQNGPTQQQNREDSRQQFSLEESLSLVAWLRETELPLEGESFCHRRYRKLWRAR